MTASVIRIPRAATEAVRPRVLRTLDFADMLAMPEPSWLVDNILMQTSGALIFGKSNAFKTFVTIDIGLSVATGRPWHGHGVKQANVLFVATEGAAGVARKRIPGWYEHHNVPLEYRDRGWLFPQELSLDNQEHVDILVATLRHREIGLLVLDIFGGTMEGTEVEDTTARAWNKSQQRIIRECGATVLTVAHTGWKDSRRARMHTHFWGSFDTRLKVVGDKDALTTVISIDRHKDADSRGEFGFRLEESHGTLVPVADPAVCKAKSAASSQRAERSSKERTALKALEKAIAAHGEYRTGPGWPESPVVTVKAWREACGADLATGKPNAHRMAFVRAIKELQASGLVRVEGEFAWPEDMG